MFWLGIDGLERHWKRAAVDAAVEGDTLRVKTENVTALEFGAATPHGLKNLVIDGQDQPGGELIPMEYSKTDGKWASGRTGGLSKVHGLQGPIDDAFLDKFVMVRPTGQPLSDRIAAWAKDEMEHAIVQWHRIFRGEAPLKGDEQITDADIASSNLVLWGDPSSNKVMARIADKLPIKWDAKQVILGSRMFDSATHVPILIYPNPLNPTRYVVINSGFTFREDANSTNSRQVPKLPDYAIIDIATPPNGHSPGKIVAAGFFGEKWELRQDDGKMTP
jgi:hypothetical protein